MRVILRVRDINGTPMAAQIAELPLVVASCLAEDFDLAQPGVRVELVTDGVPLPELKRLTIEAAE